MTLSKKNISLPVLALFLSACASPQIANIKYMDNVAIKQAEETSQSPQQICETASMAIARANKEEFTFFAPLHLELASKNLKQGQNKIKNQKTVAEGMQDCFKVSKLVENGMTTKAKVESSLSDALAELKMLKKVDEEKKFTGAIQDYVDDVIDLVKKIEEGDMNEAMQGQAELLKEMLALEVDIVLSKNLEPVEAMLEKADDEDAKDLAKKTFKKAKKELESARKFIRVYYRDKQQVKNAAALAMRKAKHAYYVAQEVETLTELKPEAAEEKVLYIESLLERINRKFNQGVVIGHSLYEQTSIIGQRLDAVLDVRAPVNRNIAVIKQTQKDATNKDNVPVQESSAQDEPKEINPSPVIADKPQPIPVKNAETETPEQSPVKNTEAVPPVADTPEQSPVKNTETAPPVADTPEQSPVKNTETAPPVADTPEQSPVKNTETAPPVADTPEQSPVKNTETTPAVAETPEQSPVKNTETAPPVADIPEQSPVNDTKTAASIADTPKQTSVGEN